jgi:hypothetical protein
VALLLIETLVDKIPAVDSINDVIQTFVRPAAGAVLFAANANASATSTRFWLWFAALSWRAASTR